jgi:hypothetical protein
MLLIVMALLVFQTAICEGFHVGRAISRANMFAARSFLSKTQLFSTSQGGGSPRPQAMYSEVREDKEYYQVEEELEKKKIGAPNTESLIQKVADSIKEYDKAFKRLPPFQVEDLNVLFYDTFLIINLSVSISFWVVHRMDLAWIGTAFNEGCLMSLLWIAAGLYTGAFLNSAVDGHFGSSEERGGPRAAGLLACNTYINAVNLRLLFAFVVAVIQHRPVGSAAGEQLMPLEIGFGLMLMIFWRALHSSFVPRL